MVWRNLLALMSVFIHAIHKGFQFETVSFFNKNECTRSGDKIGLLQEDLSFALVQSQICT